MGAPEPDCGGPAQNNERHRFHFVLLDLLRDAEHDLPDGLVRQPRKHERWRHPHYLVSVPPHGWNRRLSYIWLETFLLSYCWYDTHGRLRCCPRAQNIPYESNSITWSDRLIQDSYRTAQSSNGGQRRRSASLLGSCHFRHPYPGMFHS